MDSVFVISPTCFTLYSTACLYAGAFPECLLSYHSTCKSASSPVMKNALSEDGRGQIIRMQKDCRIPYIFRKEYVFRHNFLATIITNCPLCLPAEHATLLIAAASSEYGLTAFRQPQTNNQNTKPATGIREIS